LKEKVMAVLDSIRGGLQADGGDVELVEVIEAEGIVKVKLVGACHGCPMSAMTLQMGIERIMRQQVPEVKKVISVQDEEE
jgi:Fe-S cluster biogenesis protein NfuA